MKYVKLTILTRAFDAIYDFNKASPAPFWETLMARLQELADAPAMEKRGKFQCCYYLPIAEDKDLGKEVEALIRAMGADPDGFIVSVTGLRKSDLELLEKTDPDNILSRAWFPAAKDCILNAEPAEPAGTPAPGEVPAEAPAEAPAQAPASRPVPQPEKPQEKTEAPEAGKDLAEEAKRISELKDSLLSVVHGQRHAVDEVVQTIFECDAFNRVNDDRKGPLATFLFTGPSGVGKTFLATECAKKLGRPYTVVDMSEFSDNLANNKFNGDHGEPAVVTGFVRQNPNGVIIFDEIEKAHINTIYLFLQILDAGRLMDMKLHKEVSFKDTIVFITTNAGASLYDDPTVIDLSGVSRRAILEALRTDKKPGSMDEPFFPECITTRFANGHVLLFNHLEPFALMQIVRDEIAKQVGLFKKAYGVDVKYDPDALAALVLYSAGGVADARSLRGTAKNMIVKELQDVILQTYSSSGKGVNDLKTVEITVEPQRAEKAVSDLFVRNEVTRVLVFADAYVTEASKSVLADPYTAYEFFSDPDDFKRRARGVVDYILLDPAAGSRPMDRIPNDLEDMDAEGNDLFRYLREFFPELPVYFLDVRSRGELSFGTLLAKGGRGVIALDPESPEAAKAALKTLSFSALVNNATFSLGRSGKLLTYNCSQYSPDAGTAVITFDKLSLSYAPSAADEDVIVRADDKNGVTFKDVIGCKEAKKALGDFCRFVADPRKMLAQGKKIPKGVLLYGPPGTGKTMLAKAMANEAGAAFLPTTATALFGSLVGESEKNIRELFRRARRYAPAIIFIDEADAIARARTGSVSTAHNEDALNQFIAEMDGFTTDERRPVFIMAATNYDISGDGPRVLDPAFVRRFDRKIFVDLPDTEDRFELLRLLLSRHGVNLGEHHEKILRNLADRSSGMSNADLTVVVDMFLRECEDNAPTADRLMDALDQFRFGEVSDIDPDHLRQTACHESGHALVTRLLGETPAFLTVVARANFGGYMEHARNEKKGTSTYGELMDRVCTSLAGRAAEMEVYGKDAGLNSGASSDLANARYLVKVALGDLAMGEKLYTAATDEDCEKLMQEMFIRTAELLHSHRDVLDALTDLLTEKKSLNQAELEAFFAERLG